MKTKDSNNNNNNNPATPPAAVIKKTSTKKRRSARVLEHDPPILPGFGTQKDAQRLAAQLSSVNSSNSNDGQPSFSVEAVKEMMKARGRGMRSNRGGSEKQDTTDAAAAASSAAAAPVSSAWADFMKEEGVEGLYAATSASGAPTEGSLKGGGASGKKRSYELPLVAAAAVVVAPSKKKTKKAKKTSKPKQSGGGALLQAGTLDSSIVGRTKSKLDQPYHLTVPTRILQGVKIAKVFTAANAVHSVAVDVDGTAYGWGRNESSQLGSHLPDNVVLPTVLDLPGDDSKLSLAALGKSHTIFLLQDDVNNHSLWGVGANKAGQCGVRTFTDVPNYRKCVLPDDDVTIVQISCGEDFSVALSDQGHVYTTGSSEYGQLGNGETGEYFITANKLAFANCNVFTRRTTFCHAPAEKLHIANDAAKVVPLDEDVRIQAIACGKHHTIAVEAASDQKPRVFSWGCGNYGCLGHGVQKDEYFPRNIGAFVNVALQGNVKVAAGAHCSLLQTSHGHVYYWGKHRSVGEAVMRPHLVDVLANNQHVVEHVAAGGQTVVCCTQGAQTVAWGQGPHGELGLGTAKSSAKPTFVEALRGCRIADLACGYGHTLFVAREDDKEDVAVVKKLAKLDPSSAEPLIEAAEESKGGKKRG